MTTPNPHTTKGSDELRSILTAPIRSQISTSDIVTGMWSSTALAEKISDILAWADKRTATANREVLDAVEAHVANDERVPHGDQFANTTYVRGKNNMRKKIRAAIQKIREGL